MQKLLILLLSNFHMACAGITTENLATSLSLSLLTSLFDCSCVTTLAYLIYNQYWVIVGHLFFTTFLLFIYDQDFQKKIVTPVLFITLF